LLPYLKKLGFNTLHLLPITPIGQDGRKGDLGSPYAIKNHYEIDPNIIDPFVPFSGEQQLAALIEACHGLEIRVVLEFILRTSAKDADWVKVHPKWYYWIKEEVKNFEAPTFPKDDLIKIKKIPLGKGKYIPPPENYQKIFTSPPKTNSIKGDEYYTGTSNETKVKIPSAFADWPPDDPQPPWTDVTYLKFYNNPPDKNFNYIAYNTIRFYDPDLDKRENINSELWDKLTDLIPFYQKKYGIDGVMIDMGHALPEAFKNEMIKKARNINPQFAFWDEKFEEDQHSIKEYNAIIGNTWHLAFQRNGLLTILENSEKGHHLNYFACGETHNSPRFGHNNPQRKKQLWLLLNLLPKGMPFLHQGFELNEWIPVNTGLNIRKRLSSKLKNEKLPLFKKTLLNWTSQKNIIPFIEKLNHFRRENSGLFDEKAITQIHQLENKKIVWIKKKRKHKEFIFLFNLHHKNSVSVHLDEIGLTHYQPINIFNSDKHSETSTEIIKLSRSGFFILKSPYPIKKNPTLTKN